MSCIISCSCWIFSVVVSVASDVLSSVCCFFADRPLRWCEQRQVLLPCWTTGKQCSLDPNALSFILVVDLCYPYVTILVRSYPCLSCCHDIAPPPHPITLLFVYLVSPASRSACLGCFASPVIFLHMFSMIGWLNLIKMLFLFVGMIT